MLSCLVGLLVAASPEPGSKWTWAFEDVHSSQVKGVPDGVSVTNSPTLGKALLELKVDTVEAGVPRRFTLSVKSGPAGVVNRTWSVEANYGEAAMTEKRGPATPRPNEDGEFAEPPPSLGLLRFLAGTLVTADPIVVAAQEGKPCDAATREKVAMATGRLVDRLVHQRTGDVAVKDAVAECQGKAGRYAVRFVLSSHVMDDDVDQQWNGTVEVPTGAWRAELDLKSAAHVEINRGKKPIRIDAWSTLKSHLSRHR